MADQPDYNGTWLKARQKINKGVDWRGTQTVSIDGEEIPLGFRLLEEGEFTRVQSALPLDEMKGDADGDGDLTDDQRRLLELQRKDSLTDEEREEFEELSQAVTDGEGGSFEDHLDEEAYDAILWAGKKAMMPTEGDIEDILTLPPNQQEVILGESGSMDSERVEELLKQDMIETTANQPYPIKLTLGINAFFETAQVRGNGITK